MARLRRLAMARGALPVRILGGVLGVGDVADVVQRFDDGIDSHGAPSLTFQRFRTACDAERLYRMRKRQPVDGNDLQTADVVDRGGSRRSVPRLLSRYPPMHRRR